MNEAADGSIRRTSFTVPGDPVSWKRANRGPHGSYTDPAAKAQERAVKRAALEAGAERLARGEVRVEAHFFRSGVPRSCMSAGDADNLLKLVCDALTGIAYEDDAVVVEVKGSKHRDDRDPRTEVEVEVVGELAELPKRVRREQEAAATQRVRDLRRLLAPRNRERLVRRHLVPSVRRFGT